MVTAAPLATRVSMRNLEVVDEVCRSAFGCSGIDLSTTALLFVTGVLALVLFAVAVHVRQGSQAVEIEVDRLTVERDAFADFARRVADIEVPEANAAVPAAGGITSATAAPAAKQLERVQEAYRETVMAVPHYETDYGEPIEENLAAEFGEDVAVAVVEGEALSPQLKSALVQGSREARNSRASLLSTIEAEAESLDAARTALAEIDEEREAIERGSFTDRSYEALAEDWRRLGALSDRCGDVVAERSRSIRERRPATPPKVPDLQEYLYEELPVRHPVLADAADLAESIEGLRSRVLESLTRRV